MRRIAHVWDAEIQVLGMTGLNELCSTHPWPHPWFKFCCCPFELFKTFVFETVLICSPGWPWMSHPFTSVFWVLGLQVCTHTPSLPEDFKIKDPYERYHFVLIPSSCAADFASWADLFFFFSLLKIAHLFAFFITFSGKLMWNFILFFNLSLLLAFNFLNPFPILWLFPFLWYIAFNVFIHFQRMLVA